MNKLYTKAFNAFILLFFLGLTINLSGQVTVAPMSCYPQYATAAAMDAAAVASSGSEPFATWQGAYNYAIANSINTIDFSAGHYLPGTHGAVGDWGDASGGYDLNVDGMTVNGNGAVIDNTGNGSSQIAFAQIAANNVTLDGFTFVEYTGNNGGAVLVGAGLTGWTISNCNFDGSDWAGDGLVVNQGAGSSGTITGCNFYNHTRSTGSAMTVNGPGGDLDIINTVYSCNSRIVAGGAVRILANANVDYDGCTFDGNLTNSASGGAISIEENSVVTFNNTDFTCNTAIVNVQDDGGAMHIIEGSDVTITGCNFTGNEAQDKGGAIHVSGAIASLVNLDISDTEFDDNETQTATSYGGAIYLNDVVANITNNYFINNNSLGGNSNGGGGAMYIAEGNAISDLNISSNTFTGNSATSGNGHDIFAYSDVNLSDAVSTQNPSTYGVDICGSNDMEFLAHPLGSVSSCFIDKFNRADNTTIGLGWTETETQADGIQIVEDEIDFDGASGYEWLSRSLDPTFEPCGVTFDPVLTNNTYPLTWSFNFAYNASTTGFDSGEKGIAVILASTSSDYTTGDGYAVLVGESSSTDELQLVRFTGGLDADANYTQLWEDNVDHGIDAGNRMTVKVIFDPTSDTWTIYERYGSGGFWDTDDPRQLSATNNEATGSVVDATFTGSTMTTFGVLHNDGTTTAQSSKFDSFSFRMGDERDGCGWSGSYTAVACSACLSTTNPVDDCGPLPVDLISFTARAIDCSTELEWITASEENNHFFELESSHDGRNFETIYKVYGAGNTEIAQTYRYFDNQLASNKVTYYRLKQFDYDGTMTYSNIVSAKGESCEAEVVISRVYPNPFDGEMIFEIKNSLASTKGVIEVYNVIGLQMIRYEVDILQGENTFKIDTDVLVPGTYFARLIGSGYEITTAKLLKTEK